MGGTSEPQWIDTDSGAETTKIVGGLNASTSYQFRVRANSHVPGEWSLPMKAKTLGDGERGVPTGSGGHSSAAAWAQILVSKEWLGCLWQPLSMALKQQPKIKTLGVLRKPAPPSPTGAGVA